MSDSGVIGPRFKPGTVLVTPSASRYPEVRERVEALVARHLSADWGDIDESQWDANCRALEDGKQPIISRYTVEGIAVCVVTEADRSATTVLLPGEEG